MTSPTKQIDMALSTLDLEQDATCLDYNKLQEQFEAYGCVLIRNAYEPKVISHFLKRAKTAFFVRDWQSPRGELNHRIDVDLNNSNHLPIRDLDESTAKPFEFIQYFTETCLPQVAKTLLKDEFCIVERYSIIRRQGPPNGKLQTNPAPLHQDASFLGDDKGMMINFWTPLCNAGQDSPGIELVPKAVGIVFPTEGYLDGGEVSVYHRIDLSEDFIRQYYEDAEFWHPVLNAGDVLLFNHRTLHRTFLSDQMTRLRVSAEVRVCCASAVPNYGRMIELNTQKQ